MDEKPICHLCKKPINSKKELCRWGMFKISFAHYQCYAQWYEKTFDKKFTREINPDRILGLDQFYSRRGFAGAILMIAAIIYLLVKVDAEYLILVVPLALVIYGLVVWQFIISIHNLEEIRKAKKLS